MKYYIIKLVTFWLHLNKHSEVQTSEQLQGGKQYAQTSITEIFTHRDRESPWFGSSHSFIWNPGGYRHNSKH